MMPLQEIRDVVFEALAACFGLSADSAAASTLIHSAYTEPENAPRPARSSNVVYFDLMAEEDPGDRGQSGTRAVSAVSRADTSRTPMARRPILPPLSIAASARYHLLIKPAKRGTPTRDNPEMVKQTKVTGIRQPSPSSS